MASPLAGGCCELRTFLANVPPWVPVQRMAKRNDAFLSGGSRGRKQSLALGDGCAPGWAGREAAVILTRRGAGEEATHALPRLCHQLHLHRRKTVSLATARQPCSGPVLALA